MHGDDLLYRFLHDTLPTEFEDVGGRIALSLLRSTAVWFPIEAYARWPVLLPWVVRDPACRGSVARGLADEWSSPRVDGYLRDDNSLVKSLPRSLRITGPKGHRLDGAFMGREFVASHVWRVVNHAELASRLPLLNTFVPNLVWLPSQVAKLSDREGGVYQQTLQALAIAIYRDAPITPSLRPLVDEAWALLPEPAVVVADADPATLNWFVPTERFFKMRAARLQSVVRALETLEAGGQLGSKVIATRYTEGLPRVGEQARRDLLSQLQRFSPPEEGMP